MTNLTCIAYWYSMSIKLHLRSSCVPKDSDTGRRSSISIRFRCLIYQKQRRVTKDRQQKKNEPREIAVLTKRRRQRKGRRFLHGGLATGTD